MVKEQNAANQHLEQGKALARLLFNYKVSELEKPKNLHSNLKAQFPLLTDAEFNDVIRQVKAAKLTRQGRYSWQMIPRDLTLIIVSMLTWLLQDWKWPLVVGLFLLILFVNLFALRYSEKLSPILGSSVWFSYLALAAYGWYFYSRGMAWYFAVLAILGLALGTLVITGLAHLLTEAMNNARVEAANRKSAEARQKEAQK
ncbi:MAG: hypothetical protein VB108_03730 [Anaerolineaceae bacterium]|nr:hypothetical protein [Anaerolineaceae bacterium]